MTGFGVHIGVPANTLPVVAQEPATVELGRDGRRYEPIDDAMTWARGDRRRRVIVLARNEWIARDFALDHGLRRGQVIYGTSASVRGWTGVDVVVLPGWQERRDAERTWFALLPALLIRRRPSEEAPADA